MAPSRTFAESHETSFSGSREENFPRHFDQSTGFSQSSEPGRSNAFSRRSNRLILCFDGTGNVFQGTPGDTNIVKLYNMFDRCNVDQMHYYQPGIGTYPAEGPVNVNFFRSMMRKLEAVLDQALATSFDSHVIAGYKFIMRYYKPGDKIYIFGFSRGAFTARFLARMISHVGLLSMGNDELVPFAYKVYQEYEQNRGGAGEQTKHSVFMNSFKKHFCRTERKQAISKWGKISDNESGIKVHFLGLFDCVSSVGNLDIPFFQKTPPLPACTGTAQHIRHAVAIDERRVKFKAALFSQENDNEAEDIKEVWFPGNHGDVGGGWDREPAKGQPNPRADPKDDYFQLSDIALKWMVDELDRVEKESLDDPADRLTWDPEAKASFLTRFQEHKHEMVTARMHDTMRFGMGSNSPFSIGLWNFMELLPGVIKRWEYVERPRGSKKYEWAYIGWPPNFGGRRDIPSTALFHHSVLLRMRLAPDRANHRPDLYLPNNCLWVKAESGNGGRVKDPVERTLKDIALQEAPQSTSEHQSAESQRLVPPEHIAFESDEKLTSSCLSLDEHGRPLVDGKDWDHIYRVGFTS